MLTITNGNVDDFVGRYDGVDYFFPSGKTTAIPDDAARHIFGVGQEDKTDVLVRHGWMKMSTDRKEGMAILNNFSFNVADQLMPGDVIDAPAVTVDNGQGSAPLQTGSTGGVSDGSTPVQPTSGGSILDQLNNIAV